MTTDDGNLGVQQVELVAGPDHVIVVYQPPDLGDEIDPVAIFTHVATDATSRAAAGLRILSMTTMPLRHGGLWAGAQGSGYQTKTAVAVVYERWPGVPG
jgi:hypothetical protein